MPAQLPLDIRGMSCKVKSHSGARVSIPKTAGSDYVPSTELLREDMAGDEAYVGLTIGTNDVAHTNVVKFKASYRMLVRTAKSKGAKVICSQIFHRGDRRDLNSKIDSFNSAILQVAKEEECACINSTSSYNSSAFRPNVNILVGGRLHLKPWAKRTMANRIATVIQQIDTVVSTPRPTASGPRPSTNAPHPHWTPRRSPGKFNQHRHRATYSEQYDGYVLDSCYRPDPAPYQQCKGTSWQRYPMSGGRTSAW